MTNSPCPIKEKVSPHQASMHLYATASEPMPKMMNFRLAVVVRDRGDCVVTDAYFGSPTAALIVPYHRVDGEEDSLKVVCICGSTVSCGSECGLGLTFATIGLASELRRRRRAMATGRVVRPDLALRRLQ